MVSKYYTRFVTDTPESRQPGEFTGIVELDQPLRGRREIGDLKSALARNLDLEREDIRILDWARLH